MTYYFRARFQFDCPTVGQRIVLDHHVYRVIEVTPVQDVDLTEDERHEMMSRSPDAREKFRPSRLVVRPDNLDLFDGGAS